ncbi:MAG TPA: hypothetical protein VFL91_06435 [Thermomicrobiales bacterium]|nr:hypothetical protein [Thermomicrobiales bacterium]
MAHTCNYYCKGLIHADVVFSSDDLSPDECAATIGVIGRLHRVIVLSVERAQEAVKRPDEGYTDWDCWAGQLPVPTGPTAAQDTPYAYLIHYVHECDAGAALDEVVDFLATRRG